jgi:hypothetical protein
MPITIDEIVESAAKGVLRALDARGQGLKVSASVPELVRSGFSVEFIVRAGGRLAEVALNPQPLPPGPPIEKSIGQE